MNSLIKLVLSIFLYSFMAITKLYQNKNNYFNKITCNWSNFTDGYGDGYYAHVYDPVDTSGPHVIIPFSTQGFSLLNEDNSAVVEVSYDGIHVHDELNPSLPSKAVVYDNRVCSFIWFRLKSGSSATISIRAWAIR